MKTILCVDDDASLILLMEDTLQRLEYHTIGVHSVGAALKGFQETRWRDGQNPAALNFAACD